MATHETILAEAVELQQQQEPCALVIITGVKGTTPARLGTKMVVLADGSTIGTVGGGVMEQKAIREAQDSLRSGVPRTLQLDTGHQLDGASPGYINLYIEPLLPASVLLIAGAGHVGRALCQSAAAAGFSVIVADDRETFANPALLPDAAQVVRCEFNRLFDEVKVTPYTYIVCATHSHDHDYTVISQALGTRAPFVGLLGSRRKRDSFQKKLIAEGGDAHLFDRLHSPVGLDIGATSPQEIAVSITAQLIQARNGEAGKSGAELAISWRG